MIPSFTVLFETTRNYDKEADVWHKFGKKYGDKASWKQKKYFIIISGLLHKFFIYHVI